MWYISGNGVFKQNALSIKKSETKYPFIKYLFPVLNEYQLVEANEANPLLGKISSVSPVGSAILGRRIGDEVTVSTPGGEQIYTIDSIN